MRDLRCRFWALLPMRKYAKIYFGIIYIILKHIDGGLYHLFSGFHGAIGTGYYYKLQLLECFDNQ